MRFQNEIVKCLWKGYFENVLETVRRHLINLPGNLDDDTANINWVKRQQACS